MSFPLLVHLLLTIIYSQMHAVHCAPKIGGILFEPLLFEAIESNENIVIKVAKSKPRPTTGETRVERSTSTDMTDTKESDALRSNAKSNHSVEISILLSKPETAGSNVFIPEIKTQPQSSTINTENNNFTNTRTESDQSTTILNASETATTILSTPVIKIVNATETSTVKNDTQMSTILNATEPSRKSASNVKIPQNTKMGARSRGQDNDNNSTQSILSILTYGYNFDDTNCRVVDSRVLCGYNKNPQLVESKTQIVPKANGCRHRGDRIECGYEKKTDADDNGGDKTAESGALRILNSETFSTSSTTSANMTLFSNYRKNGSEVNSALNVTSIKTSAPTITSPVSSLVSASSLASASSLGSADSLASATSATPTPSTTSDTSTSSATSTTRYTGANPELTVGRRSAKTKHQRCVEKGDRIVCYQVVEDAV